MRKREKHKLPQVVNMNDQSHSFIRTNYYPKSAGSYISYDIPVHGNTLFVKSVLYIIMSI